MESYKKVLQYFTDISQIPRGSGNEKGVREYIKERANNKSLITKQDKTGNLVVYVPATLEYKKEETVILQAHMDMVCVQEQGSEHDFTSDPIELVYTGERLSAKGTTLGADNGIGLAMCMTAADFPQHSPLELLFTVDEEIGLTGALQLNPNLVSGKKLINLDTEDEGEICVSSAGSVRVSVELPCTRSIQITQHYPAYTFSIVGFKGGHSGVDIDKQRGNAIVTWLQALASYSGDRALVSVDAGVAVNALPASCTGVILLQDARAFTEYLEHYFSVLQVDLDCKDIRFTIDKLHESHLPIEDSAKLVNAISTIKQGIYTMSEHIPGLVQTSCNLGIIATQKDTLRAEYMVRSSQDDDLEQVKNSFQKSFALLGRVRFGEESPARPGNWDSDLLRTTKRSYEQVLGKSIDVVAVHAGLECGVLVQKMGEEAEAISFGPTIENPHSPQERCYLPSVERCIEVLQCILASRS